VTPPDTTPDAFTFTPQTDVALSTTLTSNAITVAGIDAPSPISITGGTYSVNGAAYTQSSGTVRLGNTVRVRVKSSNKRATQVCATLTIGGIAGKFCVTTAAAPHKSGTDNSPGSGSGTVVAGSGNCGATCVDGLDIDGDGAVRAETDGMLVMRYLLGRPPESMLNFVGTDASRSDGPAIGDYLDDLRPMLDIDGDGETSAATDAVLILRYLDGLRGEALIAGAVGPNATRTTAAEIEAWLLRLMPGEALP